MQGEEKKDLRIQIELAYIQFALSLFDYYEGDKETVQIINDFLQDHIRTGIDKFKKEIEDAN